MQKVPHDWALIEKLLSPETSLELIASFSYKKFRALLNGDYEFIFSLMTKQRFFATAVTIMGASAVQGGVCAL
ncbi:MAG: hypothetical protein PUP92_18535 [Rhizonema sp. PD38]|nr:hypothetical protein [Rhizonema sp. PD38]